MGWTNSQKMRLAMEKKMIDQLFPAFEVCNPTGDTYWIGRMETNAGGRYTVRVSIPPQYPDQPPEAYIVSPNPLYTYDGRNLLKIGTSHEMHVFQSENRYVRMCLYHPECWTAEYTLISCLKKARIWLEAYDEHMKNGRKMCEILGTQKPDE